MADRLSPSIHLLTARSHQDVSVKEKDNIIYLFANNTLWGNCNGVVGLGILHFFRENVTFGELLTLVCPILSEGPGPSMGFHLLGSSGPKSHIDLGIDQRKFTGGPADWRTS